MEYFRRGFAHILTNITVCRRTSCDTVYHICSLQGYYSACSGNFLSTFRDKLWVTCSRVKKFLRNVTFMGPCIVRLFQYISNKKQRYTVYYIWKLFYMFRVVPPPIIRSAYNCIYSIWYLSHRYCYLPLSCSISSTIAAGSSNGVTNTRCCRYSSVRS